MSKTLFILSLIFTNVIGHAWFLSSPGFTDAKATGYRTASGGEGQGWAGGAGPCGNTNKGANGYLQVTAGKTYTFTYKWTDTKGPYTRYLAKTDADLAKAANELAPKLTSPATTDAQSPITVTIPKTAQIGDKYTFRVTNNAFNNCIDMNVNAVASESSAGIVSVAFAFVVIAALLF
eukprot:TRINITY_DN4514_c0_g1_i1.p1 TRINITY_DN4514_c0_g1~~TRINITY_DN4514_c0_g1_i1.p1  ORF type:complete len:177 (-),score=53.65 TRINITY_DN4514_c0_g1_i1:57-587(-)